MVNHLTLAFCRRADPKTILLGMKRRGFGAGRWNGFGGKVEPDETVRQAAVRELVEESGVVVHEDDAIQVGVLRFTFQRVEHKGKPMEDMEVGVFESWVFDDSRMAESDEVSHRSICIARVCGAMRSEVGVEDRCKGLTSQGKGRYSMAIMEGEVLCINQSINLLDVCIERGRMTELIVCTVDLVHR
jgi:hypothetical protein